MAHLDRLALSIFVLCAACGDAPTSEAPDGPTPSPRDAASQGVPDGGAPDGGASTSPSDAGVGVPLGSAAEIDAWLASGAYRAWTCEAAPHERRSGSGHSRNRICANPTLSQDLGSGPYPVGSIAVKELYDAAGAIDGYSLYAKIKAGAGGDTWFWYERIGTSVVARGEGASICVGCHSGAPRDHAFTPSPR